MTDEARDLVARVDPAWDDARTERALAGLHRRRARRRARGVALGVGAVIVVGALLAVGPMSSETEPSTPPRAVHAPPERDVRLADGSRIVTEEGGEVVVAHVTDERVDVRLDRGAARFDVVPGLPRRFSVDAGPVTVRVLGTAFRVERLADARVSVSVERGRVEVAWADGREELGAGEEGVFPREGGRASVNRRDDPPVEPAPVEPASIEPAPVEPTPVEPAAMEPAPVVAAGSPRTPAERPSRDDRPEWRALARAERYDEAYAALGEAPASVSDRVEDLMLAADVARRSGHPAEALPWLAAVERDHPSDPRAAVAAFTRGRILMELGRHAEAGRQLERVLTIEPRGSLAEDALARAALAHAAAGDAERAAALARRYHARHVDGRWARRLRALAPPP